MHKKTHPTVQKALKKQPGSRCSEKSKKKNRAARANYVFFRTPFKHITFLLVQREGQFLPYFFDTDFFERVRFLLAATISTWDF